jgi:hypothetical protein
MLTRARTIGGRELIGRRVLRWFLINRDQLIHAGEYAVVDVVEIVFGNFVAGLLARD